MRIIKMEKEKKEETIKIKEQIIDSLEGGLIVTSIKLDKENTETSIICKFMREGKKGVFRYYWNNSLMIGIDYVRDYDEDKDEDIYGEIHNWVERHFKFESKVSLKYNGKEMLK